MTVACFPRLSALADRFDALILDVWGVVMDGAAPYPGAAECLAALADAGKTVLLLSNAPRRAARVAGRLAEIGVSGSLYADIVSSGEACREAVATGRVPGLGGACYHLGPPRDDGLFDGLAVEPAPLDRADFVLATGLFDDDDTVEAHRAELDAARARGLPMLCANPDRAVVRHDGRRALCAGALADAYEARGGAVRYFGKPWPEVYRACLERLDGADRARVFAVGDNLETDIAGARAAGLPAVLVQGGVLAADLRIAWGESAAPDALAALCRRRGVLPDMAIPAFLW